MWCLRDDFVVDELGDSAIGLTMTEETVYGVTGLEETLVGFQIGRLLGFVSVLRSEAGDFRIPTLFAAQEHGSNGCSAFSMGPFNP